MGGGPTDSSSSTGPIPVARRRPIHPREIVDHEPRYRCRRATPARRRPGPQAPAAAHPPAGAVRADPPPPGRRAVARDARPAGHGPQPGHVPVEVGTVLTALVTIQSIVAGACDRPDRLPGGAWPCCCC